MRYIIGVDLDNTLVSYDAVMRKAAVEFGWIEPGGAKTKKDIRDKIRRLPEGETKWRQLQAFIYGQAMDEAVLIDGVKPFFQRCKKEGVPVYIVSHKAKFAAEDVHGIDLRKAALDWMQKQDFFDGNGLGLSVERIYFEATRQEKAGRIKKIGCTHFIDDLQETFLEPAFPADTQKILFALGEKKSFLNGMKVANTWEEISGYFFNANNGKNGL